MKTHGLISIRNREYRAVATLLVMGLGIWIVQNAAQYFGWGKSDSASFLADYGRSPQMMISIVGILCYIGYGVYVARMLKELKRADDERERLIADLTHAKDELHYRATHDNLSGLWNRTTILEALQKELAQSCRDGSAVGVIIADVDHFKEINDQHGHLAGDAVLRAVSERLSQAVRASDFAGRYGGEEFILVLRNSDVKVGRHIAERLRSELNDNPIKTSEGSFPVRMSFGVAAGDGRSSDVDSLVRAADQALYRAKKAGRNRVEVWAGSDGN